MVQSYNVTMLKCYNAQLVGCPAGIIFFFASHGKDFQLMMDILTMACGRLEATSVNVPVKGEELEHEDPLYASWQVKQMVVLGTKLGTNARAATGLEHRLGQATAMYWSLQPTLARRAPRRDKLHAWQPAYSETLCFILTVMQ